MTVTCVEGSWKKRKENNFHRGEAWSQLRTSRYTPEINFRPITIWKVIGMDNDFDEGGAKEMREGRKFNLRKEKI